MSKHKSSRVGQRMKPRGEQKPMQNEEQPQDVVVSTIEGQPEGTKEPVSDVEASTETPSSLERKESENGPDGVTLAELLRRSGEKDEKAVTLQHNQMDPSKDFKPLQSEPDLSPEAVQAAIDKDAKERHEHVADAVHAPIKPEDSELTVIHSLGTLPNGDLGVVITIPEEMVTSVKGFAETDGNKPVEQWCSEFFVMMLEGYCTPNKGR